MPTMHYISREVYAEYHDVIDRLPGEMNDNSAGSVSSNKRVKTTTTTTADDDSTNVEATCHGIINARSTGNGSVQPNNGPGSMNTSIGDADGGKPCAGQNKSSDFGSDCDDDSTICFSGGEGDYLSEDYVDDDDDEPSKADIERAMKQQSKLVSDILRDDEMYESIFQYDKQGGYELCCFDCHCGECPEEYDSACLYKEVLPSQTSASSVYARIHRWCCPDIHSLDKYDQEYACTNYVIALRGGGKEERTKNGIFHQNNSFLLKAKKNANALKAKVDNNNMYKGKLSLLFHSIMLYFNV